MKFRLVEDIDIDELEEDLQDRHREQDKILDTVRDTLLDRDFEEKRKLNGVSFNKTIEADDYNIICQFYVDTTTFNYSAYINTNQDTTESNYANKGEVDTLERGLNQFLFQLEGI